MSAYQVNLPGTVYGGDGALGKLTDILTEHHIKKVAVFSDSGVQRAGLLDAVLKEIKQSKIFCSIFDNLATEPTVEQVNDVMKRFRACQAQLIIAVGGGSVMDTAKLASVLDTDAYTLRDLLNAPGQAVKQCPTLMIPSTAGTGSEATPNSIVTVPEQQMKVGIVNPEMIADYVILDPVMIRNLPVPIAASTGMDALAHAVECYISNKATPFSDLFAARAIRLIFSNLECACGGSSDMGAKESMMLGSFYAGIAIAAAGTTAVHGLAYPLGGRYHIPHGLSNAMLLAPVMRFNCPACRQRLAQICEMIAPERMALGVEEKAEYVVTRIEEITKALGIPTSLQAYGIGPEDLEKLVEAGMQVTRLLANNPRPVTAEDARNLYLQIM